MLGFWYCDGLFVMVWWVYCYLGFKFGVEGVDFVGIVLLVLGVIVC